MFNWFKEKTVKYEMTFYDSKDNILYTYTGEVSKRDVEGLLWGDRCRKGYIRTKSSKNMSEFTTINRVTIEILQETGSK